MNKEFDMILVSHKCRNECDMAIREIERVLKKYGWIYKRKHDELIIPGFFRIIPCVYDRDYNLKMRGRKDFFIATTESFLKSEEENEKTLIKYLKEVSDRNAK